jgi:transposase
VDKQSLESLLHRGESVERIAKRFGKDPSTVSYWMKKHGLSSPHAEKHAAKGGLERERLQTMVVAGLSISEIAAEVGRSKATVRHWLKRYELKTLGGRRRAARKAGLLIIELRCPRHGRTSFFLEARGSYRCKRCRVESVVRHRQKLKAMLVAEAGGRCSLCGYDRDVRCSSIIAIRHSNALMSADAESHIRLMSFALRRKSAFFYAPTATSRLKPARLICR